MGKKNGITDISPFIRLLAAGAARAAWCGVRLCRWKMGGDERSAHDDGRGDTAAAVGSRRSKADVCVVKARRSA